MRQFVADVFVLSAFLVGQPVGAAEGPPQHQEPDRSPRFLVASALDARPVTVDVTRTPLLGRRISLALNGVPLKQALMEISRQAELQLVFSDDVLPPGARAYLLAERITVAAALTEVLFDTGLDVVFNTHGRPVLVPRSEVAATEQRGEVTGRVVESDTRRPVAGARVAIPGGQETRANDDGRFQLQGVPAGEVRIQVQMIGYAAQERTVSVSSGGAAVANFELTKVAFNLDEVIVTGTAGGVERRAIGNAVASVRTDAVLDKSPIVDVEDLLVGRTTSVRAQSSPGQVGTGAPIIIRGVSSMTQGNDPIVYIDGVRMNSNPRDGISQRGGANQSRLNDIHPSDIESLEIIKGPAAATLYGTEASNGVIQIITKRGQAGRPQFDITTRTGFNWMQNPEGKSADGRCMIAPAGAQLPPGMPLPADEEFLPGTYCMNVYENERLRGRGPLYGNGLLQSYNVALRGGTNLGRYSASVSRTHDVGVVDWNWDKRTTVRLNVETLIGDQLSVSAGGAYISGKTRLSESTLQTSAFHGIIRSNAEHLFDNRRGWAQVPPEDMEKVEARNDVDRTTLSLELRHQPVEWLTHRLVTGVDRNTYDQWILYPRYPEGAEHFYGSLALGQKDFTKGNRNFLTVDYSASADLHWRDFSLQPAIGFQYYKTDHSSITASGGEFPAIPITTVSGGAVREAGEVFSENSTVGVYVQQTLGWKNRAFVTGAVRADDNSAFGKNFDTAIYPKVSGTWVMSEEPFWNVDFLKPLRLRGAWGAAGKQPEAFAASRLYAPAIGYQNQPALIPAAFGNADLKPERGEELEIGFDATVLGGRVELGFTRYFKRVKDAILERPLSPSTGFPGSQLVNIGLVHAWGNEVEAIVRLVQGPRFAWELDTQFSTMGNKIKDMGGLETRFNREGYPIQSHFGRTVLDGAIDANRQVVWATCDGGTGPDGLRSGGSPVPCDDAPLLFQGPSQPTWQFGIGSTFTLFGSLRLNAQVSGNGGHLNTHNYGAAVGHRDFFWVNPDPMKYLIERYGQTTARSTDPSYKAGFLRLSELSATYDLPDRLVQRVGARRGSISLGMRNVAMLWTAQHGWSTPRDGSLRHKHYTIIVWDPDIKSTDANPGVGGPQTAMPPTASAVLTLRISF